MSGKYDDIIDLPHHISEARPQMSMHERAAQFAPFAALRGYKETIDSMGCRSGSNTAVSILRGKTKSLAGDEEIKRKRTALRRRFSVIERNL